MKRTMLALGLILLIGAAAYETVAYCFPNALAYFRESFPNSSSGPLSPVELKDPSEWTTADLILLGARAEIENKTRYDHGGGYYVIDYPGGDIDPGIGVCTDTVIRALRHAGLDLQQLIHDDMKQSGFSTYPQNWGLAAPDSNIDHRRIPNQREFLDRYGLALSTDPAAADWQHGDLVYWRFPDGREHCGVISDRRRQDGSAPLVIHNAWITAEQDCLERWEITGHYRYPQG